MFGYYLVTVGHDFLLSMHIMRHACDECDTRTRTRTRLLLLRTTCALPVCVDDIHTRTNLDIWMFGYFFIYIV